MLKITTYDWDEFKLCPKCLKEFKDKYGQSASYLTVEERRRIDEMCNQKRDLEELIRVMKKKGFTIVTEKSKVAK